MEAQSLSKKFVDTINIELRMNPLKGDSNLEQLKQICLEISSIEPKTKSISQSMLNKLVASISKLTWNDSKWMKKKILQKDSDRINKRAR